MIDRVPFKAFEHGPFLRNFKELDEFLLQNDSNKAENWLN